MAGSKVLREAVRRRIRDGQRNVDLIADVNVVVAHGAGAASSAQRVTVRQGHQPDAAAKPTATPTQPSPEEDTP
jgi:hypothetical protein